MTFSNLLEAFEPLNAKKRDDPDGLDDLEAEQWRELRHQIEEALFQFAPDPSAERREHLRVPVSLQARYWTRHELKDRYISVLGEGGLFISTVDPLPVGSEIDLEIVLAEKDFAVRLKGEVVWSNADDASARPGMGIQFVNLSYEQKAILYNLVDDTVRERLLERRQYTRLDSRLPAMFIYAEGSFEMHSSDLSVAGMFVASDHLIHEGERVRMLLDVPGVEQPVRVAGRVIRTVPGSSPGQPAGFGVDFRMIDPVGRQILLDYMVDRVGGRRKPAKGGELRAQPRIKRRIKLRFEHLSGAGTSYCRDISSGGVFIRSMEPPPMDAQVDVTLEHPTSRRQLTLRGRVVRQVLPDPARPHRVAGAGVRFHRPGDAKRRLLQEFLKEFVLLESSGEVPDSDPPPAD